MRVNTRLRDACPISGANFTIKSECEKKKTQYKKHFLPSLNGRKVISSIRLRRQINLGNRNDQREIKCICCFKITTIPSDITERRIRSISVLQRKCLNRHE